jgi:hypothetical protein
MQVPNSFLFSALPKAAGLNNPAEAGPRAWTAPLLQPLEEQGWDLAPPSLTGSFPIKTIFFFSSLSLRKSFMLNFKIPYFFQSLNC